MKGFSETRCWSWHAAAVWERGVCRGFCTTDSTFWNRWWGSLDFTRLFDEFDEVPGSALLFSPQVNAEFDWSSASATAGEVLGMIYSWRAGGEEITYSVYPSFGRVCWDSHRYFFLLVIGIFVEIVMFWELVWTGKTEATKIVVSSVAFIGIEQSRTIDAEKFITAVVDYLIVIWSNVCYPRRKSQARTSFHTSTVCPPPVSSGL